MSITEEVITPDFIKSIVQAKILKEVIAVKKWGGKGGKFVLKDIKVSTLEFYKTKAIEMLYEEEKTKNCKTPLEEVIALNKKTIYNGRMVNKDNKGYYLDFITKIIYIPCQNYKHEIIHYGKGSLDDYNEISEYTYHIKMNGERKTLICGVTNKPLAKMLLKAKDEERVVFKDGDSTNCMRDNIFIATDGYVTQSKRKNNEKREYSSEYKGVGTTYAGTYRATISFEGKYIHAGTYKTETEAARAYDVYAYHYYRENCLSNGLLTEEEKDDVLQNGIPEKYRVNRIFPVRRQENKYNDDNEDPITYDENGEAYLDLYSKGKVIGKTIVSEYTWHELNKIKWRLGDERTIRGHMDGTDKLLHVYIYERYVGPVNELTVDHKNINFLDNRVENLRLADHSLQNHNKKKADCAMVKGVKGVTINGRKFVVNPYGDRYSFDYLEDASEKFNELCKEKYGDEATLNPPMPPGKTKVMDLFKKEDITIEYVNDIKYLEHLKIVIVKLGLSKKIIPNNLRAADIPSVKNMIIEFLEKEINDGKGK